jgi:hypothetical protein
MLSLRRRLLIADRLRQCETVAGRDRELHGLSGQSRVGDGRVVRATDHVHTERHLLNEVVAYRIRKDRPDYNNNPRTPPAYFELS